MKPDEVKKARRRLGVTQQELGKLLGVSANSVARWERGVMGMRESAATLLRLLIQTKDEGERGK